LNKIAKEICRVQPSDKKESAGMKTRVKRSIESLRRGEESMGKENI
jgi:hypothetical protein